MPAGCRDGYGVFVRGSSQSTEYAWKKQYVENFACKPCPAGEVPFVPGSNLELVWDGKHWQIQPVNCTGIPSVRMAGLEPAINASLLALAAAEAFGYDAQSTTAAAVQSWYGKAYGSYGYRPYGAYMPPPVFPGQCVPCPEGTMQEGWTCECVGSWQDELGGLAESRTLTITGAASQSLVWQLAVAEQAQKHTAAVFRHVRMYIPADVHPPNRCMLRTNCCCCRRV